MFALMSRHVRAGIFLSLWLASDGHAIELSARNRSAATITADEAREHIQFLADDTLEGREAGSRGGRAAAIYLVQKLEQAGLKPAGTQGFYQSFGAGYSNVLALLPGSDSEIGEETIVVGAHYDHVGYGARNNSYGPLGQIHNGADDNASGVTALLEIIDACRQLPESPRRSVLFAFWDGEEKGLLGSKHWLEHPTVPLKRIVFAFNSDMMGRLRDGKVEVLGCRTSATMRKLVSRQNVESGLTLDFTWELKENSDHHPFAARRIPVLMFYTGMHEDYHRPSDDADRVNCEGLARVDQLLLRTLFEVADSPALPRYRPAAMTESPSLRQSVEKPGPTPPSRLGLWWDAAEAEKGRIVVSQIEPNSPASKAGFRKGDHVVKMARLPIDGADSFRRAVMAAPKSTTAAVRRGNDEDPAELAIELSGDPIRLGITWRADDGEEAMVALTHVVPGSPAAAAGLQVNDRVYSVDGREFSSAAEFGRLLASMNGPFDLLVESKGLLRSARLAPLTIENSHSTEN